MTTRMVPRYDCQDEHTPWCDEQASLAQVRDFNVTICPSGASKVSTPHPTADRLLAATQREISGWLDNKPSVKPVQKVSDAAHQDPQRNLAARLSWMTSQWLDNPGGRHRSCEKLREMQGLLTAIERNWYGHLEQVERGELVGLGLSDKAGALT